MAFLKHACFALVLSLRVAHAAETETEKNPVRKVINLLESMKAKIEAEGVKEKDLYTKFMCYCKNGLSELEARVAGCEDKIPQLEADIKSTEEALIQAKADLATAEKDRAQAKDALATAIAIRAKDAAAFKDLNAELEGYLAQIKAAVAALEKGMAGGFLQSEAGSALNAALKKMTLKDQNLVEEDKELMLSFLSGKEDYAPQSGEIVGILKQMADDFAKQLKEAEDAEAQAVKDYAALVAAKQKEIATLQEGIEAKIEKIGELGMQLAQLKDDSVEQAGSLVEDKELLAELKKGCTEKDAEYAERVRTRAAELAAISDTIKILNDDDALELFKKTLPAPSLVQFQISAASMRSRALTALSKIQAATSEGRHRVNFLVLALKGKKIGFDKVIVMIVKLIHQLQNEQASDLNKKEYCELQFDYTDDKKKDLTRKLADLDTSITSAKETIAALAADIANLEASIKELDKNVAEATELRKEENDDFLALVQSDSAAKQLLTYAKNRLNKFYNPKMYNPPAKKELSEQGAIERDMTLVQISEHSQRKSLIEPPPATWDAYAKLTEESAGAIRMIDLLISDLDKELAEAKVDEDNSQKEYHAWINDAGYDRASMSRALRQKSSTKADLEADLLALKSERWAISKGLMATDKYIAMLHAECDWLLQYYDVRQQARAGEIDALGRAKAVLSGADYSM